MKRRGVGLVLACLLACGSASGQQKPRRPGAGAGAGREEAWKVIDAYVVSNLQESLGLTEEQFTKLLPLVRKLQKDRREQALRRRQALQELRRALASGAATEAGVVEQLKTLKAIEFEEPAAVRKDLEAVDAALLPLQQARFRVMELEIEARIRELMNRAREQRRSNRGGKGPLPPPDEDAPDP